MNDDIVQFFKRSSHCKPEIVRRIVADIDTISSTLRLCRKITTWGTMEQPKICLYGGLPLSLSKHGQSQEGGDDENDSTEGFLLPIQIWITHQFPIEPPMIYMVGSLTFGEIASTWGNHHVRVVNNHPNVDVTGLCFCRELNEWHPGKSSLCVAVERLGREIERSGVSPLYLEAHSAVSEKKSNNNDSEDECVVCYGVRDTVLVPCGHLCLCIGCASNILECPMCRTKIMLRQRIFL